MVTADLGELETLTTADRVRDLPPCNQTDRRPSYVCRSTTIALLTLVVVVMAGFLRESIGRPRVASTDLRRDEARRAVTPADEGDDNTHDDNTTHVAWVERRAGEGTAPWVLGLQQESCADACARAGLFCRFEEDSWPIFRDDVTRIAGAFNHSCKEFFSTENPYEPSISGTFCSHGPWKPECIWGDKITYREKNVRSCKAIPPVATTRLCQCSEIEKPKLTCSGCDPNCWRNHSCCPDILDPCAEDPEHGDDEKYWGSSLSYPAPGVDPDAWCQQGHPNEWVMPEVRPYIGLEAAVDAPSVKVKVLSYNLYWWHLFEVSKGNEGSAGKLISEASSDRMFDLMGFQECQDPGRVLYDAGFDKNYTFFQGPLQTCMAFKSDTWTLIKNGTAMVAEDGDWVRKNDWGKRTTIWMRLRHKATGRHVFFMNHHGPLPLHSGGMCGGLATAYNLLQEMHDNMQSTDAVILVGDFNANFKSMTVRSMASQLNLLYHGASFGGVDNFFANVDESHLLETHNYGHGGSDHDALGVMLELTSANISTLDRAAEWVHLS